ncbi:MAG TPA: hypothetical protein VH637_05575 [Streptosporangiaceae bacterium]
MGSSNSTQYALLTDGRLYAWGLGTHGQLGNGRSRNAFRRPVRLPFSNVSTLAGASNHAVYDADGTVYACGQNLHGTLGDGSTRSSTRPVTVAGLDGAEVSRLVASFANAGALLKNGEYYNWGFNGNGQLGNGHPGRSAGVPVRVRLPFPVTEVAQGGSYWNNGQTLALLSDGSLWSWGDNWAHQLGTSAKGMRPSPVRIHPPAGVSYQRLASGSATSYAVTATGDVYAWGTGRVGQVGNGQTGTATRPVLVASGAAAISSTANNVVISLAAAT